MNINAERERERAEEIQNEIYTLKSLMSILCDHFECKRFDDLTADYYSLQYHFKEYTELAYTLLRKLGDTEEQIKILVTELYKEGD